MISRNSPACTAFNWLLATDTAQTLTAEIRATHDCNLAIAQQSTTTKARELVKTALAGMPKFLGEIDPACIENLVTELMPPDHE